MNQILYYSLWGITFFLIIRKLFKEISKKKEKEEKKRHTCAICGRVQKDPIIICDDCFEEGI